MGGLITKAVSRQLRQPSYGPVGYFVKNILRKKNTVLEVNAVRLSNIEPDHHVLELGFGPGIGLQTAYHCIKDGTGVIYGIDFSQEMVAVASRALANEIKEGKVTVTLGDVMSMPYKAQSFDVVYHCNCFYFWPDLHKAAIEIRRVMKLGSTMVTTINVVSLKAAADAGFLDSANTIDHNLYMDVLKEVGFQNVRMEDCDDKGFKFQVIYADFKGDMKGDTMKNIAEY